MNQSIRIILGVLFVIANLFSSPLDWRMYSNENSTWFCSSSEIQIFTPASRSLRPLTIDQTRLVNRFYDFFEYDGYLWLTSDAGIYKVDMNSMSAERIALPGDSIIEGHITIDMDYAWVITNKTLFKFDQLGQEWQEYSLPESASVVNGIYSTGEEVFCAFGKKLYRHTVSTEKWDSYLISNEISQSAQLSPGVSSLKFIDKNFVKVYQPSSYSWDNINTNQPLSDYVDEDSIVYYCAGKSVYKMNIVNSAIRPFDIPGIDTVYAIERISDTVLVATGKRLIKYDTKTMGMDFIEYSSEMNSSDIEKVVAKEKFVIVVYSTFFALYDKENRGWQIIPRSSLKKDIKRFSWNSDGLMVRYSPGYQSVLRGTFEDRLKFEYEGFYYDTTFTIQKDEENDEVDTTFSVDSSEHLFSYSFPDLPSMNLNLHTSDPQDRSLDVSFNNTSLSTPPEKGVYYKGNRDDRLNNFKLGTTSNDQLSSTTFPQIKMEGISLGVESKKRVEGRDRKVVKFAAGSGAITSRTELRTLPYRSDGSYYLMKKKKKYSAGSSTAKKADTVQIIPGTLKVWVDGQMLDSTYYTFFSPTTKLQFVPDAPVDPASAITIQYKTQTIPDGGIDEVEFVPSHNFGTLHFGSLTISPKDWISARIGIAGLGRDTSVYPSGIRNVSPIVNVEVPIELRNEKPNLFLKLSPEYSFNSETGKRAGSAALQSRIGNRTGIILNGMFADQGYYSTDTLSYGYGGLLNQYDATVTYDIKTELPLRYYQHYRNADKGAESRYSASAGAHFQGIPFFDVTLSRTTLEHYENNDTVKTAFDSLWNAKDKLHMRLYETSSKFIERLTHMQRISYDLSYSQYRRIFEDSDWLYGKMTTAEFTIAPINQIMLTGNMLFRIDGNIKGLPSSSGRPSLDFQTIDAPKGVDFNARYYVNYSKYTDGDSCTDTITRTVDVVLKPGMWHPAFKWFSPRFALSNDIYGSFSTSQPGFGNLITANTDSIIRNVRKEIGVNIFPSDAVLFRNKNEFINLDTTEIFKTSNDLQIWNGTKNFWQAIFNYSTKNEVYNISVLYDRTWCPWLRTSPGFAIDHIVTDTSGSMLSYGPSMKVNLNLQNVSIIKTMSNSHDFKLGWTRKKGKLCSKPGVSYSFNLALVLMPNIQFNNIETVVFKDGKLSQFQSETSLVLNF